MTEKLSECCGAEVEYRFVEFVDGSKQDLGTFCKNPSCGKPCTIASKPEYSLNCSQCGCVYPSSEGFPKLQICPKCSGSLYSIKPDASPDRLLTDEELHEADSTLGKNFYDADDAEAWLIDRRNIAKVQDAKTYPLAFEAGKKQGKIDALRQVIEEARTRINGNINVYTLQSKLTKFEGETL